VSSCQWPVIVPAQVLQATDKLTDHWTLTTAF
jgi:hypothetical protein